MRVLHISTKDTRGGAAGSAYRLHRGLLRADLESYMYVRHKDSSDPTIFEYAPDTGFIKQFSQFGRRMKIRIEFEKYRLGRPEGLEPFSDDRSSFILSSAIEYLDPHIINLHWVAHFIDYRHFFRTSIASIPIVWRLSDLNPFTGGCHYDCGCGKYKKRCGACPQLGSTEEDDLSRSIWKRKQEAFASLDSKQLHFVAQSEWIKDQVQASPLTERFPVHVIPNGLDTDVFQPRETSGMRSALDIPPDNHILLFVAQSVRNRRKGFDLLSEALSLISQDNITLLSIGGEEPEVETKLSHIHIGTIDNDMLLSSFYSLADIFIIPSRQDNLPNTVIESMACGTPVVGFNTGGIPDLIRPSETGWLAERQNIRDLRDSIENALGSDEKREYMSVRCREIVKEEYTIANQVNKYIELYKLMCKDPIGNNSNKCI